MSCLTAGRASLSKENCPCVQPSSFSLCSDQSIVRQCWSFVVAADTWKRGLLYVGLSVVCYINVKYGWQMPFSGALMDLAGILYFVKYFRAKQSSEPYKYKQLSVT